MNVLHLPRSGRRRLALAAGVAIATLTVVGGPAAANAASTPAPRSGAHTTTDEPVVVGANCAPYLGGVKPGRATPLPDKPVADDASGPTVVAVYCDPDADADAPSIVEVPGAKPDFDHVQAGQATPVDAVAQPVGGGGRTTTKR